MTSILILLSVAILLWGTYGLTLFSTHVVTIKDKDNDFKPFNSPVTMISAGICLWIIFFIGTASIIQWWHKEENPNKVKYELIREPIYREVK